MKTIFIDTHCHLNFKRFSRNREEVIKNARSLGLKVFIVPGTDIVSSQKAVELAVNNTDVYAAVGIHPHHVYTYFEMKQNGRKDIDELISDDLLSLSSLLENPRVVAVGEIGMDTYQYTDTKYAQYVIHEDFLLLQKNLLEKQFNLALKYKKSLILHNRETKKSLLEILNRLWNDELRYRTVFHCCEPDEELLAYAKEHNFFIGIDGDVTYGGEKAEFAKKIPLEMLVLETDSPFLLPEPLKTQKLYPNTPSNIPLIAQYIADLRGISLSKIAEATTRNAMRLFNL